MKIGDIIIGERHRKDMGDLDALAESIRSVGLLQPLVVTPENVLVSGERRLHAVKALGWEEVPVHIADGLEDALKLLIAERDENTCRKDFTHTERYAAEKDIADTFKAEAAKRQRAAGSRGREGGRGKKKPKPDPKENPSGNLPEGFSSSSDGEDGRARKEIAEALGGASTTMRKVAEVMTAAEKDPEAYGDLAEALGQGDVKVDKVHKKFKRREMLTGMGVSEEEIEIKETPDEALSRVIGKVLPLLSGFEKRWPVPERVRSMSPAGIKSVRDQLGSLRRRLGVLEKEVAEEINRREESLS